MFRSFDKVLTKYEQSLRIKFNVYFLVTHKDGSFPLFWKTIVFKNDPSLTTVYEDPSLTTVNEDPSLTIDRKSEFRKHSNYLSRY